MEVDESILHFLYFIVPEKDYMDVEELWNALQSQEEEIPSEDKVTAEMRSAFKLFDPESKGIITVDNLKMGSFD